MNGRLFPPFHTPPPDCREILFGDAARAPSSSVAHLNNSIVPLAAQRVDDRVQRVADDS